MHNSVAQVHPLLRSAELITLHGILESRTINKTALSARRNCNTADVEQERVPPVRHSDRMPDWCKDKRTDDRSWRHQATATCWHL